jgi:hypothetical protein
MENAMPKLGLFTSEREASEAIAKVHKAKPRARLHVAHGPNGFTVTLLPDREIVRHQGLPRIVQWGPHWTDVHAMRMHRSPPREQSSRAMLVMPDGTRAALTAPSRPTRTKRRDHRDAESYLRACEAMLYVSPQERHAVAQALAEKRRTATAQNVERNRE